MIRNPLARHVALFLAAKAVLIGLGLWWFLSGMPEPRGMPGGPPGPSQSAR